MSSDLNTSRHEIERVGDPIYRAGAERLNDREGEEEISEEEKKKREEMTIEDLARVSTPQRAEAYRMLEDGEKTPQISIEDSEEIKEHKTETNNEEEGNISQEDEITDAADSLNSTQNSKGGKMTQNKGLEETNETGNTYELEVVEEISKSLDLILEDDGGSARFVEDVLCLDKDILSKDDIEDELSSDYSDEEINGYLELMDDAGIIDDFGFVNERLDCLRDIANSLYEQVENIEDSIDDVLEYANSHDEIDEIDVKVSANYLGRASENFTERNSMERVIDLIGPFKHNRRSDSNSLAVLLNAIESESTGNLAEKSGYANDNSANARVNKLADEGYLQLEQGEVEATEAGKVVKDAVDQVYEVFEKNVKEKRRKEDRINRIKYCVEGRLKERERAEDLDRTIEGVIESDVMNLEDVESEVEDKYSALARKMSEKYQETHTKPQLRER